ncbi:MAG: Dyp-type peroxidase [Gemmatimonadaceae bacterium]
MQKLHKLRDSGLARFAVERGFQRKNRRELFGFRDGLRNPDRHDRTKIAFIDRGTAPHEPAWTGGGSYLVYLKIKQNFDSFDGLSEPQQEDVLGRKLDETGTRLDKPLGTDPRTEGLFVDPAIPPPASHVRKAGPRLDAAHDAVRIFRRGVPYSEVDNNREISAGLQFVSFQWSTDLFNTIYRRWIFNPSFPPGSSGNDALLDRCLIHIQKGGLFFIPPGHADEGFIGSGVFEMQKPPKRSRKAKW